LSLLISSMTILQSHRLTLNKTATQPPKTASLPYFIIQSHQPSSPSHPPHPELSPVKNVYPYATPALCYLAISTFPRVYSCLGIDNASSHWVRTWSFERFGEERETRDVKVVRNRSTLRRAYIPKNLTIHSNKTQITIMVCIKHSPNGINSLCVYINNITPLDTISYTIITIISISTAIKS